MALVVCWFDFILVLLRVKFVGLLILEIWQFWWLWFGFVLEVGIRQIFVEFGAFGNFLCLGWVS